jgi:type I restriction enzyme S subunit
MLSEVPTEWRKARIDEVLQRNTTSVSVTELAAEGLVAHYSLPAFDANKKPVIESGSEIKSNKTAIDEDCLLFSKLNPRIPRVWRVRHSVEHKPVCSTEFWALKPKTDEVSLSYAEYFLGWTGFLSSPSIKPASSTNSHQRVDRKAFDAFLMPLPPINEQHRIAEILSSVDESIQATQAVIEQAERVKRGLMEELLTGGLGSEAIERGEVPDGWAASTFGDEIDFKGGNQPPKSTFVYEPTDGYIRLLQIRDFESDDKPAYIPVNATKVRCSEDDILIARYGASLGRICRGKEGAYNVALVKLILSENLTSDYAFYWLNSDHFQNFLARVGSRSAQAGFNKSDLSPLSLVVPPLEEQKRSSEILASLDGCITTQKAIIEQLARTKRGLMDDLLTGKVRTA